MSHVDINTDSILQLIRGASNDGPILSFPLAGAAMLKMSISGIGRDKEASEEKGGLNPLSPP